MAFDVYKTFKFFDENIFFLAIMVITDIEQYWIFRHCPHQSIMERTRQIFCACEQGDVDSVQTLLDQGCDVDSVDEDENTPLQVASANGHEGVVRLLIMRGAGLDKRNVFGWTPLLQVGASHAAWDKQPVIILISTWNKISSYIHTSDYNL